MRLISTKQYFSEERFLYFFASKQKKKRVIENRNLFSYSFYTKLFAIKYGVHDFFFPDQVHFNLFSPTYFSFTGLLKRDCKGYTLKQNIF